MHKKVAVTVFFLLISLWMLAQTAPAPTAVTTGSNLLEILLITTVVVLVFVIWGMGQVLIALSRQLMNKNKAMSKITTLSVLLIFTLLSQNVLAQAASTEAVVKDFTNYGGISANTFYLFNINAMF